MLRPKKLSHLLAAFVGWVGLFAIVYHVGSAQYASVMVWLAERFADLLVAVSMRPHPQGLVVLAAEARQPIGVPYSLYQIGLNAIFAPALVLVTVGVSASGLLRTVAAILIVLLLQAFEVVSIVLFHLSHPDNLAINLGWPEATVSLIGWVYRFIDRMAYAFFPFFAWFVVCLDVLFQLLETGRSKDAVRRTKSSG